MSDVFSTLHKRGFIAQLTHENEIKHLLKNQKITFYIGFDPTADSLHVGHFLQMMVMAHMQRAGHRPIAIIGGGTALVGDPTGKTDMRKMLTREEISHNADKFKAQMSNFIDFSNGNAIMLDNADWLLELKYVDFLRSTGVHFSVNRMLTAECFKSRLEKGLSFIEFNYMLMQSYDFLKLYEDYDCILQLGGDDQWSNILGGIELIRRVKGKEAYGMTFNLLVTSEGRKMGKTEAGAIWLDENKTTPYEFYQYWRNIDDADVIRCMKLLTFLLDEHIEEYSSYKDSRINDAKKVLAYEVTKLVHGEEKADAADKTAQALFGGAGNDENMPSCSVTEAQIGNGTGILDLLVSMKIVPSKAEGRRLIQQGGLYMGEKRIDSFDTIIYTSDFQDGFIIFRKGKKNYTRLVLEK